MAINKYKTGEQIIAERKARARLGVGAYPAGDQIIAQRKASVLPDLEWQDIQRQEREVIGGSEDFIRQMVQDIKPSQPAVEEPPQPAVQKPVSEIRPYTPTAMDRLKGFVRTANEKIKGFLYGVGSMAGGDALSRAAESLIEKDIKRKAERTGDDTLLKMYKAEKEYWTDERQFNRWLGRQLDTELSATDKFARGAGEVVGEITQIALLSELTAPLKIYQGTSKVLNILGRMPQQAAIGAALGAEGAYGAGGDSEQILREALKSAGFFTVGGAAADAAGIKMLQQLKPIYEKYPQYRILLNAAYGASRGLTFGIAGVASDVAISKAIGEKPPTLGEVVKTGLAMAGAEMFLSMLTGTPFRVGMSAYEGFRSGAARIPFDENLTAKNLKKNGYVEFRKGTGIWIKTDLQTGAHLDMQREMININGYAVFKSDIFLTEKKIGRKLTPKELAMGAKDPNYFRTLRGESPVKAAAQGPVGPEPATAASSTGQQGIRMLPGEQGPGSVTSVAGVKQMGEENRALRVGDLEHTRYEGINVSPVTSDKPTSTKKPEKDVKLESEEQKIPIKYGKVGTKAFKKWAANEYVNADLSKPDDPYTRDFRTFFEAYYNAGREGKRIIDVKPPMITSYFPPFLENEFYNAGVKDAAAVKAKQKTPPITETAKEQPAISPTPVTDDYYISISGEQGTRFEKIEGARSVKVFPGIDTFAHRDEDGLWIISEGKTGARISQYPIASLEMAIKYIQDRDYIKKQLPNKIEELIKKGIISPRYRLTAQEQVKEQIQSQPQGKAPDVKAEPEMVSVTETKVIKEVSPGVSYVPIEDVDFRSPAVEESVKSSQGRVDIFKRIIETKEDYRGFSAEDVLAPIEVTVENGKYIAREGNHRLMAYKQLGYKQVPIIKYDPELSKILDAGLKNATEEERRLIEEARKPSAAVKEPERDLTNRELLEEVKKLVSKGKEAPKDESVKQVRADGEGALEGVSPEDVRGSGEKGTAKRSPVERAGKDETGAGGPDRTGDGSRQGVGAGKREAHPTAERGGQTQSVKDIVKQEVKKITADVRGKNAVIKDEIELGGDKQRARDNIEAIQLVKQLERENRPATPEEQAVLLKYVGWGGLANVTYKNHFGQPYPEWATEHNALKELVTDEEWQLIRESTLNAHYTSISVIKAMYKGLEKLGFEGGKILEPALGVGHFIGAIPTKWSDQVVFTGVEIDKITGAIAKKLYPLANIHIKGFEQTNLPDNYFDVAISNVPFGSYGVVDKKYPDYVTEAIHNYFFAKALDKVRPGGLVMFITSRYTLDAKTGSRFRNYLAERGDFLGAIRLPNTAFKSNARTEVVTDIIILKKREPGLKPAGEDFLKTGKMKLTNRYGWEQEVDINEYFLKNPSMMLGRASLEGSMYRSNEFTVEPGDTPLPTAIANAFNKIKGKMDYPDKVIEINTRMNDFIPAPEDVKQGAFTFQNGKLYIKDGNQLVPYEAGSKKAVDRIRGLMAIRDEVRRNMRLQLDEAQEAEIKKSREKLNKLYDTFVQKFDTLHSRGNALAFGDDPDYYLLLSIENYSPETKKATKGDIFTKNTLSPIKRAEKAETGKEALVISLNETGRVNLPRMAQLTGKKESDLVKELEGLIFKTPEGIYETAERYLSGNVRQKLRDAEAMAEIDPAFKVNVEALKKVQPKDRESKNIRANMGAPWIPPQIYISFLSHLYGKGENNFNVSYVSEIGEWSVSVDNIVKGNTDDSSTWGTNRLYASDLIEKILNNKGITVKDKDPDTEKYFVNKKETTAAQEKAEKIKAEFEKWIWSDPEREKALVELYNEKFNNINLPVFDGSHLDLPGSNPAITFRPHQKNAIWRIISSGGNTLIAQKVGAGKSGIMFAAAMELRRMGVIKKPMMVFPNHLVPQMGEEFLKFYPGANILVATKKDFETKNRKVFLNRIATGDYDAVLVGQSQFGMISMSEEAVQKFYQEQIDLLESFIREEVRGGRRGKRSESEKNIAAAIKRLKTKMGKELEKLKKDKSVVTFEELGVDSLFVDEAQDFKNLMYTSNMRNVSGLGTQEGSGKAFDLYMKVRYLQQLNGGRGVVFATATPVMNTMAEMYTMQRYLQGDLLKQRGLEHFDAWARTFGQVQNVLEMTPEGKGFRQKQAFSRFVNLGNLIQMFRSFADVLIDVPGLKVPALKGGRMQQITVEPSKELIDFIETLAERANAVREKKVDPSVDNLLKITGEGRKAALDMRLIDPSLPDNPNSKVNRAVQNIYDKWLESKKERYTQLVFLDLSIPKAKKNKDAEIEEDEAVGAEEISVYDDIKRKLVLKGIPEKEIAFIHDAKTDAQKLKLFDDMNTGNVRILIGSTAKMGTGMNVQRLLKYAHHLDCPWRPGDIEQRNGRIIRQGNENEEVEIYVYNTERSFDARMWDTLTRKQRFIEQIMTSDVNVDEAEDIGEIVLSFQEIAAIASGNPLIQEQVANAAEVNRLLSLRTSHYDEQRRLEYDLRDNKSLQEYHRSMIERYKADLKVRKDTSGDNFVVTIEGTTYTDRKKAGEKLLEMYRVMDKAMVKAKGKGDATPVKIGKFAGFDLYLSPAGELIARGAHDYKTELSADGPAMFRALTIKINGIDGEIPRHERKIEELKIEEKKIESRIGLPFEHEEKLQKALIRKAEIERELNPSEDGTPIESEDEIGEEVIDDNEAMPAFVEKPQRISSADTSINVKKLPAVFNKVKFEPGTVNADIGGGRFDNATEFLATQGVENIIWDPYNRSPEHNAWAQSRIQGGQADTATISNVLNVIAEEEARLQVIENAADVIKPHGVAYFTIYEGDSSGIGKETPKGYQLNRKSKEYLPEVREYFRNVVLKNGIIEARDPIKESVTESLTSKYWHPSIGPATGKNVSGKAKRASEIVKDFENRLEMAIKKGGLHWSRLGQFNNKTYITRIVKANDIPTLSHESGHYLDKLYDLTHKRTIIARSGAESEKIIAAMMKLGEATSLKSYSDAKKRREGIAEFTREYLTNREQAVKKYPDLAKYFQENIPPNVLAVIEDIARDISDLVNLDPVSRGMKHVWFKGDPRYPVPLDLPRKLRQLYTGVVDATYPVEWAAGELGGRLFQDIISNELSMLRGWEGIALADINPKGEPGFYQSDLDGNKVGPSYYEIVKDIHKDEQTRREFWIYSIARRSVDYFKRGLDLPDSPETYRELIRILELRHPEFKEIFDKTREYRSNNYDLLVQGGVYSSLMKAKIELANPNYVSLKRIKEAFDYVAGTSPKLGAAKRVVKRLKGGGEDIMDPEENDINNTFIYRSVAMRNRLLLKLVDAADKAEGKGLIMSKSPTKVKPVQFNLEKVRKYLYDVFEGMEGIEREYYDVKQFVDSLDLDTMARIFNPQYLAGPNQVVVYRDGEPVLYDVHPDLYEAIQGLTPENVTWLTELMMGLAQVQKTGIIYTPLFIYRNASRDTFHNLVSSDTHLNPVDIFMGFYSVLKGDKWYRLAARKGGTTNYFTANDRKFAQDAIDEIMSNGNKAHEFVLKLNEAMGLVKEGYIGQGLWAGFKSFGVPLRFLQDWIEPGEMAGRMGEMKRSLEKYLKAAGYTDSDIDAMNDQKLLEAIPHDEIVRSIARGRNLSVDFRKMGKWIKRSQMNRLVNFLNPSIQGTVNVGKLLVKHPWRTIAKGLLYITSMTLFNLWLCWDNENYRQLPWWRRDFFWNIPIGDPKTTHWFFPIPRPWELGILFGAIPERLAEAYLKKNPNAWKEFYESVKQAIVPEMIPSAAEPFYRDATGKDWRGRPILTEADKRVSPELQYNEYTSILVRRIAEGLANVPGVPDTFKSPKRLQRIIEGYTGTLGRMFLESIDMTFGSKPGIPIIGGLTQGFVADAYWQPQSVSDFYDYRNMVQTEANNFRRLHKDEDLPDELEAQYKMFNAANEAIQLLDDAAGAIERSNRPNKALELAAIRADIIDIARAVNEFYEKNFLRKKAN